MSEETATNTNITWPTVTIYVLNWNGRTLLESCLPALTRLDYPDYNIVLIDNHSEDDSIAYAKKNFPQITIIENEDNIGFSRGMNVGLRQHQRDVAVLLNTDVEVRANWLTELVRPIIDDPTVGITGSKLYYGDGRTLQHAGVMMEYPRGLGRHRFYQEEDVGQADTLCEVDYVTGAAMAISQTALQATGGFDEDFSPFYYEEVDLCLRAKAAGCKVTYAPKSVAIHHESMTFKKYSRPLFHNMNRNRLLFLLKHLPVETFLSAFVPAEKEFLSQRLLAEQLQTMHQVYVEMLLQLDRVLQPRNLQERTAEFMDVLVDLAETAVSQTPTHYQPSHTPQQANLTAQAILQTSTKATGRSMAARIRQLWGNIAARWLLQNVATQQTTYNQAAARKLDEQVNQQQIAAQEIALLTTEITNLRHNLTVQKKDLRTIQDRVENNRKI